MIIDTTYLLPLARINVKTDFLRALVENGLRIKLDLSNLKINLISIFELQAKSAKLGVPPFHVYKAINTIFRAFRVIPFYKKEIIQVADELRRNISDYIDCIIVATAIVEHEPLVTEDKLILGIKDIIRGKYGIDIYSFDDLIK